jgi:hypothetical protein
LGKKWVKRAKKGAEKEKKGTDLFFGSLPCMVSRGYIDGGVSVDIG